MPSSFEPGAILELRGETWRLAHTQRFETCAILTLEGRERSNRGRRFRVIDPFDRPRPIAVRTLRNGARRVVIASALTTIEHLNPSSGLWTAAGASIDLWPYQLEPALAVIGGATRLLLADAVGLGKTIQAGLILAELRERGWSERALIVCPAGLRDAWARELRQRFRIEATVLDLPAIAERTASLPPGVSPWSGHGVTIASLDFVKRPEMLAAIQDEPIDLLIADEAHHLAPGTDRGAAVSSIAARAPWCVLVSATPHSGDRAAFEYLTSIGAAGDAIAIFRRRRRDVGLAESRRTHVLAVRPTVEEAALLAAIEGYARALWLARGRDDPAIRLLAMFMARRAASSAVAIARTVARRAALLAGQTVEPATLSLPWDETESGDLDSDAALGATGFANPREELQALDHLGALAERCALSSKFTRLRRWLDAASEPAVVFTEYRDTLDAAAAFLRTSARRLVTLHGGMAPADRRAVVDAFNIGAADVLIATDAAGEGLNLHHRCRLVIDLELPWNPRRLEQRIGRVDRLGQRRTVHAVRLFHPGTIENAVLNHIRIRRRRAEDALDRPVSDLDVAAAIFAGASLDSPAASLRSDSIDARLETRRLERQRRSAGAAPPGMICSSRRTAPMLAITRTSCANPAAYLIGEHISAWRITLSRRPATRRAWLSLIDRIESIVPSAPESPARDVLIERIHSIRSHLKRAGAVRYQRSLFDRRPDADAAARRATANRLDDALVRVLRSIDGTVAEQRSELIAIWPEPRR